MLKIVVDHCRHFLFIAIQVTHNLAWKHLNDATKFDTPKTIDLRFILNNRSLISFRQGLRDLTCSRDCYLDDSSSQACWMLCVDVRFDIMCLVIYYIIAFQVHFPNWFNRLLIFTVTSNQLSINCSIAYVYWPIDFSTSWENMQLRRA